MLAVKNERHPAKLPTTSRATVNMFFTKSSPPLPVDAPPLLKLEKPNLDTVVRTSKEPSLAFLNALVAMAASDGDISPVEYDSLIQAATAGQSSSIVQTHAVLSFLDTPAQLPHALTAMSEAISQCTEHDRRQLFKRATPLISIQGDAAWDLARQFAAALRLDIPDNEFDSMQLGIPPARWNTVHRHSLQRIKGRNVLPIARECIRLTGDTATLKAYLGYMRGEIELDELSRLANSARYRLVTELENLPPQADPPNSMTAQAQLQRDQAEKIFQQIGQRLAMVGARIDHEKMQFDDEFEECIHDAGNAVELEMRTRFDSSDWKDARVWKHLASSSIPRELERRIDRLTRRHEKQLHLLKEDLRLFKEEFALVQVSLLKRPHHTQLRPLIPQLRTTTHVKNTIETAADTTIGLGVLAGLGAGSALYALGSAVVAPIIAPIVPLAVGAMVVAGIIKAMMDSDTRKSEEVSLKREAFEKALREHMESVRTSYFAQMDTIGREFRGTADAMICPVILEADALLRQTDLQNRISRRVIANTRNAVQRLSNV